MPNDQDQFAEAHPVKRQRGPTVAAAVVLFVWMVALVLMVFG